MFFNNYEEYHDYVIKNIDKEKQRYYLNALKYKSDDKDFDEVYEICDNIFSGNVYAWVTPEGKVIPVAAYYHEPFVKNCTKSDVYEYEKRNAHIGVTEQHVKDTLKYVEPRYQTQRMKDSVYEHMKKYPRVFYNPKY